MSPCRPQVLGGIMGWRARVTMRTPGSCAGCWGGELVSPRGPQVLVWDARVEISCHHADPTFWCGMLGWRACVTMRTPVSGAVCWDGELCYWRFWCVMLGWRALLVEVLVWDAGVESSISEGSGAGCWDGELSHWRFWCMMLGWRALLVEVLVGCWDGDLYYCSRPPKVLGQLGLKRQMLWRRLRWRQGKAIKCNDKILMILDIQGTVIEESPSLCGSVKNCRSLWR